jgi:ketosteroid isomerase-like protein
VKHIFVISLLVIASTVVSFGWRSVYSGEPRSEGVDKMLGDNVSRSHDDGSALLRMEHEWNEALRTRDVAWFERNLAADVTDISSRNGSLHTKAQDIEALKADKTVYESLELSDLRARVEGNAGVVTGVNHIKGRDEQGQPFDVRLSFTDTYIRRDGRWQVWASQHTRVRT